MRKPIQRELCTGIGYVKKVHGLKGEIMISFEEDLDELIESLEYLFLEVEGLLVPFFIDEFIPRNSINANLKLEGVNSQEKALHLVGCKIFVESEQIESEDLFESPLKLIGYLYIDRSMGAIGEIQGIDDYNGNLVLTIDYHGKEILIPLVEELIVSLDEQNRTLIMASPDGIFEMNE